jgi:hypothetical protein
MLYQGKHKVILSAVLIFTYVGLAAEPATESGLSAEEEMARKAQDPLGNVRAIMTESTIAFKAGDGDTNYGTQFQPVYAIPNSTNYNMILRGVIPVAAIEPGTVVPRFGSEPREDTGSKWGISDSMVQFFLSPKTDGAWKYGIGPQVSLKTHTSDRFVGPGWGAGLAGVVFSGSGNWSYGGIAMQHWGEDDFSIMTIQPIVMYNLESITGAYVGYNNSSTYDWNADSGDRLTLPLGLTAGRTILLGSGNGLDMNIGAYGLAVRPENGPEWQLKFGLSYFFN